MFWDTEFWESIVINYASTMATALTLFMLGFSGYEVYLYRKKRRKSK